MAALSIILVEGWLDEGEDGLEDKFAWSREAWLKSVERFSKILEEELERAKAGSAGNTEIREIELMQLKLLSLWKKQIPRAPREASDAEDKARWIKREPGHRQENPP